MDILSNKGLNVSILQPETKLLVETQHSFYEIKIIEGKHATIFGGTTQEGLVRFQKPVEIIIHGSTWGGSLLKIDWIGYQMFLEFHVINPFSSYLTSEIKNVTIENQNTSYSLNWEENG